MTSIVGTGIRRLLLLALLGGTIGLAEPTAAQATGGAAQVVEPRYIGLWESWETLAYDLPDGSRRCVARAIFEGFLDGDVLWVFNTAGLESLPWGYLAVDTRHMAGSSGGSVAVERGGTFALTRAPDGYGYNDPAESRDLLTEMRRLYRMRLTIEQEAAEARSYMLSLRGITRATDAAAEACGFPSLSRRR